MSPNTPAPVFNLRRGGSSAKEAEEAAKKAAAARRQTGPEYFSIPEDNGRMTVRFLTDWDDLLWVEQHSYVPTKPAPKGVENWPKSMNSVCRKDKGFNGYFSDCYICDFKIKNTFGKPCTPQVRIWALAVERELVIGDGSDALGGPAKQGLVVGTRDKTVEIDQIDDDGKPTGNTLVYPKIIIINQPYKSFFGSLSAMHGLYGSICGRDVVITREGTGTDTKYRFNGLDPVDDLKPGTPKWDRYLQSLAERKIDLTKIIVDKASDAYYARFFDPRYEVDKDGNITPTGDSGTPGAMTDLDAVSGTAAVPDDLRARLQAMGTPAPTA